MFDFQHERLDEIYEAEELSIASALPKPERPIVQPGFQLPRSIWVAMFASYAVFFTAMAFLVDFGAFALFMVVISALYTAMYFGAGSILARLPRLPDPSPLDRGMPLETWCGPMDRKAVAGQVLIVPMAVAFFGVSVAVISALVG